MELSFEIKEEIRKTQEDLRKALYLHQKWVSRLYDDENSAEIKSKIEQAENNIVRIGQSQKRVFDWLRSELIKHQDRLKASNKIINADIECHNIASQLLDHQKKHCPKKRFISLLKPSVLNEIHVKSENFGRMSMTEKTNNMTEDNCLDNNGYENNNDNYDDDMDFINATENFSLKEAPSKDNQNSQKVSHDRFRKTIKTSVNSIETLRQSPSPKSSSSKSSSPSPVQMETSPTPSPPFELPLPESSDDLPQEMFLRILGLITPRQRQILEKKRNERKKRLTTSTNKNEYVYENFDMNQKKRKNNFPYLQQNIVPPQTRAQKMRRQQLKANRASNVSPNNTPPSSPPLSWSAAFNLPRGLTIQPVPSPSPKVCTVCKQNDVQSLLINCPKCKTCFHTSCGSSYFNSNSSSRSPSRSRSPINMSDRRYNNSIRICPECGEELKESKLNTWVVASKNCQNHTNNYDNLVKEKLIEKKILRDKNRMLTAELRRLESKADTLKENIESRKVEKKQLISNQNNTRKRIQKIFDFVSIFKNLSESVTIIPMIEKESVNEVEDLSN